MVPNATAFSGSNAQWSESGGEIDSFITGAIYTKQDMPYVQDALENGETGVNVSWELININLNPVSKALDPSMKETVVRKATPQPPHPLPDGTMVREIETLSSQGRYVRSLWHRNHQGVWTRQPENLNYWHSVQRFSIESAIGSSVGWWKWHFVSDKTRAQMVAQVMAMDGAFPNGLTGMDAIREQSKSLVSQMIERQIYNRLEAKKLDAELVTLDGRDQRDRWNTDSAEVYAGDQRANDIYQQRMNDKVWDALELNAQVTLRPLPEGTPKVREMTPEALMEETLARAQQ
jgi:hypothetical protein